MTLHPRTRIVAEATHEIGTAILDVADRHQLTFIELTQILGDKISLIAKHALRAERHPNSPDTPADQAEDEGS